MAVPESGQLLPGLENRVYVLTSYPDGTPAETTLSGGQLSSPLKTDESGVAVIPVNASMGTTILDLKAVDTKGREASASVKLEARPQAQSLLLRTGRAVHKVGDKLRLETFSTRERGAVYLDVVKDGQTLLTRAVETEGGRGRLDVDLTPEMFGAVEVRAYQFNSDADRFRPQARTSLTGRRPSRRSLGRARDLPPGEEARIDFRATDARGRPVSAAIGVEIVDERSRPLRKTARLREGVHASSEGTPDAALRGAQFSFEQVCLMTSGERARPAPSAASAPRRCSSPPPARSPTRTCAPSTAARLRGETLSLQRALHAARRPDGPRRRRGDGEVLRRPPPSKEGFGRLQTFSASEAGRGVPLATRGATRSRAPARSAAAITLLLHQVARPRRPRRDGRRHTTPRQRAAPEAARKSRRLPSRQRHGERRRRLGERVRVEGFVKDERGRPAAGVKVIAARATTAWPCGSTRTRRAASNVATSRPANTASPSRARRTTRPPTRRSPRRGRERAVEAVLPRAAPRAFCSHFTLRQDGVQDGGGHGRGRGRGRAEGFQGDGGEGASINGRRPKSTS